ncbi:MAG: CD1871A family CXXC motif-containing protein [Sphaerochaetaceae bacterium]|nr:CD1871A family CXXC motif-containing protein [Sphaerochaetaceae bacterium]
MSTEHRRRMIIPAALIAAGVVLILLGILGKEHLIVLQKATVICLECVGIG